MSAFLAPLTWGSSTVAHFKNKQKKKKRNLWTQRSTFNLTIGRNERRQTKWACSPCGASHQQLVLVLTLIHWRKETKDHGGEERKKRQRKIDYDSCHMQAINYYHLCDRITISSVTRPVFISSFNLSAHIHAVSCNYCYV